MAGETNFLMKKLGKMQHFFALFSQATQLPFVEVDSETYDDCVYLFANQNDVQAYAKSYTEKKILLAAGQVNGSGVESFMKSLHCYGVNAIRYIEGDSVIKEELSNLVAAPDLEAMKNDKIPRANAEMQLTGIYFAQELKRPIQRTQEEHQVLRDLEEEMAVNMMRSKWIVCADVTDVKDGMTPEEANKVVKLPYIKLKDGSIYQPVFSDMTECQKFNMNNKGAKFRLQAVSYDDLPKYLLRDAKGFCFNPRGFNLLLTKEIVEQLKKYAE